MTTRKPVAKKKTTPKKKPAAKRKTPVKKPVTAPEPNPVPVTETQANPVPAAEVNPSPELAPVGGLAIGDAPHISVPDFDDGAAHFSPGTEAESPGAGPVQVSEAPINKDAFFGLFQACFAAPNTVFLAKGKPALKSLNIGSENENARKASDALYDIIAETDAIKWMLDPGNKWTLRYGAIAMFVIPTLQAAYFEYRAVNAKPVDDREEPEKSHSAPVVDPVESAPEGFEVDV